jgi:hypothetical protein
VRIIRADRYTDSIFRIWLESCAFVTWGDWLYLKSMVQTDRAGLENVKSVKLYHAFPGTPTVVIEGEEA